MLCVLVCSMHVHHAWSCHESQKKKLQKFHAGSFFLHFFIGGGGGGAFTNIISIKMSIYFPKYLYSMHYVSVSCVYFSHRQQTWLQEALMCLRLTWSSKVHMYFTFVKFTNTFSIAKSTKEGLSLFCKDTTTKYLN